jgi:ATP-dependent helicase YprA (DUF1998 family)
VIDRLDPLETAKNIEDSYKRYLKTLLAPRNERLAAAFDAEIDKSRLLTKGPILEITPPYETGASCRQLIDEGILQPDFARVTGFEIDRPLYVHQETAIRKFAAGRNLVVSTGTGSGKTECFLIPIINALLEESAQGRLGPGVRAILLYPMNALANDQLKRLRELLAELPEVTFGRYTGETPEDPRAAEEEFRQANPTEQRLPNELLSREEMRRTPPHFLLTNYAMLEYLLLRPKDIDLFDGQFAGTWRFIVMDEAHVYDGAQGSEVALLIRRLKQRVAPGRALQCIATSASLTGSVRNDPRREAMEFAQNLFDAPFEYHDDDPTRQDLVEPVRRNHLPISDWQLTGDQLLAIRAGTMRLEDVIPAGADPADTLHREASMVQLKELLSGGPMDARELRDKIWPDDEHSAAKLDALVDLGSRVVDKTGHPVLSARYHLFVRATEGAFVSFNEDGPRIFLSRHEVDPDTGRAVFEFGTCNRCGAVHLAGDVIHRQGKQYFLPSKKFDSSVNWLVLADSDGDVVVDEDELTLSGDDGKSARVDPTTRRLCTGCGVLLDVAATTCQACDDTQLLLVREHPRAKRLMERCTECGTQARQAIRRLRTDVNAAPAVVTTALYQQLPEATGEAAEQVGGGRKLLMFSDSRQAAAFAAPYLDRTYTRILERRYITQALRDPAGSGMVLTVGDLAILTREKAQKAGHFPRSAGQIEIVQAVNQWISGELMTLETRQSLEGLGLMRVELKRDTPIPMRGFTALGLTEDEGWALLNELVKTVRLQGAITLLERVDIKDERFAPRNTRVRIRSTGSDSARQIISWNPSGTGTTNARMTFLEKVLAELGNDTPPGKVLEGCWKLLESGGYLVSETDRAVGGQVYQLDHTRLAVTNGADCQWYQCDTCRLLTAFSVRGVCPNSRCTGRLRPFHLPDPEDDANHYRVLYLTMNTAPLTAREHTAQWDAKTAALIQQDFISGKVNVLSCSTTFELGVDVGDLQSVVMRNMPPKTANYVQRAGRAGRRAASAALVVTYANRSAHDLAQYQDPRAMIAGKMRIPWVPVDNGRIARRHVHSVALAAYFRHCADRRDERWTKAGEFFLPGPGGSPSPASRVADFLKPVPDEISEALEAAIPQSVHGEVGITDGSWVQSLVELLESVEREVTTDVEELEERIQESVKARKFSLSERLERTKATIIGRDLLGFLANRNILPKYGFPVDTVALTTIYAADPVGRQLELDRDLSMAIYEYAPGNQIVAGGRLWTSAGLKKRPDKEWPSYRYRVCPTCGRFERGNFEETAPCPSCKEPFRAARTMVIPEFGFIAASDTRDVGTSPPERRWHGGSFVETPGDDIGFYQWTGPGGVKVTARAGVRAWLAVVSEGAGDGFQLCSWCGWAQPAERGSRRKKHSRPTDGKECSGPLERVSLGHRYQSDVAEFTFQTVPYNRDHEGNWRSALYAILEGASYALEISRDDIDGTLSWTPDHRRSIVLYDTVPGGAGAARKIAQNVGHVMETAVTRVKSCDCGEETSCYGCLRTYGNARYHEQLSRRGALDLLTLGTG